MHVRRSDFRGGWEESEKDRGLVKALISKLWDRDPAFSSPRGHWSIKTWLTQTVCAGFSIYHQTCSSTMSKYVAVEKKSLSIKHLEIDSFCLIYSAWIITQTGSLMKSKDRVIRLFSELLPAQAANMKENGPVPQKWEDNERVTEPLK